MRRLPGRLEGRDRPGRGDVEGGEGEQLRRGATVDHVTGGRRRGRGQQSSEVRSDARSQAGPGQVVAHWRRSRGGGGSEVEDHPVRARGRRQVEGGERLRSEVRG